MTRTLLFLLLPFLAVPAWEDREAATQAMINMQPDLVTYREFRRLQSESADPETRHRLRRIVPRWVPKLLNSILPPEAPCWPDVDYVPWYDGVNRWGWFFDESPQDNLLRKPAPNYHWSTDDWEYDAETGEYKNPNPPEVRPPYFIPWRRATRDGMLAYVTLTDDWERAASMIREGVIREKQVNTKFADPDPEFMIFLHLYAPDLLAWRN